MIEDWIRVRDMEDYEISTLGRVRNAKTKRVLKPHLNRPNGYERVDLHGKHRYIHKMMIDSYNYHGLQPGDIVKHRDGNKRNNKLNNLKLVRKEDRTTWGE